MREKLKHQWNLKTFHLEAISLYDLENILTFPEKYYTTMSLIL